MHPRIRAASAAAPRQLGAPTFSSSGWSPLSIKLMCMTWKVHQGSYNRIERQRKMKMVCCPLVQGAPSKRARFCSPREK